MKRKVVLSIEVRDATPQTAHMGQTGRCNKKFPNIFYTRATQ